MNKYEDYKQGDRVHVEFDGVVSVQDSQTREWLVVREDNDGYLHKLWHTSVRPGPVSRCDPQNWPPKPGDVWKLDNGELVGIRTYIGRDGSWAGNTLRPGTGTDTGRTFYSDFASDGDFKAMDPVLVYRPED